MYVCVSVRQVQTICVYVCYNFTNYEFRNNIVISLKQYIARGLTFNVLCHF